MKKNYTQPTLRVAAFKAESGFAATVFSTRPLEGRMLNLEMIIDIDKGPVNEQYAFDGGSGLWK